MQSNDSRRSGEAESAVLIRHGSCSLAFHLDAEIGVTSIAKTGEFISSSIFTLHIQKGLFPSNSPRNGLV